MADISGCLQRLGALAHPAGGWGYRPEQEIHLEPTCLALLALSLEADRYGELLKRGRQALAGCAGDDGAYRLTRGRDEATWPTALVLFVQAALAEPAEQVKRTAQRLLSLRGQAPADAADADTLDIDFNLIGWPWAEDNFSWVEPPAWACLALRRAGFGGHKRVDDGQRLLLDRALEKGGINYGNKMVFGRLTAPQLGPTALMLLALQDQPTDPRIDAAVAYLQQEALASEDLEHLAWARLALTIYREHAGVPDALPVLEQRLHVAYDTRQEVSWLKPSPVR